MEINKIEADFVQLISIEAGDAKVRELSELQLSLIGGGIGDPVAA